ncbi:MAG: Nramp family divalent metal transporter [Planctomycetes bacterium]|nr:Nramp family divalent metal transporter [Planctomycetota bacterium]
MSENTSDREDSGSLQRSDEGSPDVSRARRRLGRVRRRSLPEVHSSVPVQGRSAWRRLLTFTGPAFMVSVGYMDPGNWATDLAAGARFGYRLIWIILLANLMAILLQTLSARLGIVTGRDLAQACREHYPRPVVWVLWILCEIAIAACDLAEVLGSAIALHLLFGVPILWGVLLTAFDVMVLLLLQSYGIRKMEAVILALVATVGACFALEMFFSRPPLGEVMSGFAPGRLSGEALFISIGILGATVMPHNLYLHSALVQSRAVARTREGVREANRFNLIDSVVALNGAFLVNSAILVLAAAAFHSSGHTGVASLEEAHALLAPLLGTVVAPVAFAVALLAAGQSSTVTGTLAGQIVMEGFIQLRLRPWLRRLLTRSLAIVPAVAVILVQGESAVDSLLVLSQVILSLQLTFAVVPLIHFTGDRKKMGEFASPSWVRALAWMAAAVVAGLNLTLVYETIRTGFETGSPAIRFVLFPASLVLIPLLAWMVLEPAWRRLAEKRRAALPTPPIPSPEKLLSLAFKKIGIALEVSPEDGDLLAGVVPLARAAGAEIVLIHAVESAAARFLGEAADDDEVRGDADYLERVAASLRGAGLAARVRIGTGEPEDEIARIAREEALDLIVTGSHGHRLLGDLLHGSTTSELRHRTAIPVLTFRTGRLPP